MNFFLMQNYGFELHDAWGLMDVDDEGHRNLWRECMDEEQGGQV